MGGARRSAVGGVEDLPEAVGEGLGEACDPGLVDEADAEEVAEVCAVLVAEGGEFDADEGVEVDDAERAEVGRFFDFGIRGGFARLHDLFGEGQMNRVARARGRRVEEEVEAGGLAIHEPSGFKGGLRGGEVFAADEQIDILRVADGGLVDGGNPGGDGVVADHGVRNVGGAEGGGRTQQALAHEFHGGDHSVEEVGQLLGVVEHGVSFLCG